MTSLFFPQLMSGALAQYPFRKTQFVRTVKNVLQDGSMILFSDSGGARLIWQLAYTDLSTTDLQALQAHFNACLGPFHGFTFIDPTENMLVFSSDLTNAAWQRSSLIQITSGTTDPEGASSGFTLTNTGQTNQEISQTFAVPANYQYCFSVYVTTAQASEITLIRGGATAHQTTTVPIGPSWTRVVSSGRLNDSGTSFTVALSLSAGEQVQLYGLQLEPQVAPSRYRPTSERGGVYSNAHWGVDQLPVIAEAPNLYSTSFSIETTI
ncbi:MAG: hypothetical protein JOZ48_08045 [Acidobacteriaceae bacterium]|nr:hypothetical protein [Acidobacteriaceae bacterium]